MMKQFNELTQQQLQQVKDYVMPETEIKAADLGLLFGTRHGLEEFYNKTMELYESGMFEYLVVSGGVTGDWDESEASIIKKDLVKRGYPETKILIEDKATNTGQNVDFSMRVVDETLGLGNIKSLIAIGKISSARRYLMTLEKWWPECEKMIAPVNYFSVPSEKWYENVEFRDRVMFEIEKIPGYIQKGFIKELDPNVFLPFPKGLG